VADVQIRRGRVEAQLHAQPVAALETRAQVLLDVDLDRALAQ